jgi:hypothetical protein
MGATLTFHINDNIPEEVMQLFFANHIGHKLGRAFPDGGYTIGEENEIWGQLRKKYPIDPKKPEDYSYIKDEELKKRFYEDQFSIHSYFARTPKFEIGEWSTLKAAIFGDDKYFGEYYGHGDYSIMTVVLDDNDLDGYGALITSPFIEQMKIAAEKALDGKDATKLMKFLKKYKGKKVFIISW